MQRKSLTYLQNKNVFFQQNARSFRHLSPAIRQFLLMRFLQFPTIASSLAKQATSIIQQGGFIGAITESAMKPLTKSFSVGDTVNEAVKTATPFLEKNQHMLLDYVEEMLKEKKDREAIFFEMDKLLDAIKDTSFTYIPIKATAFIDHAVLEKISKNETMRPSEAELTAVEINRFNQVINKIHRMKKMVFIDQEYPHQKKAIFNIMRESMERFNTENPCIYATLQATDIECADLVRQLRESNKIKFPAVKLVNGAYVNWAHANGYGHLLQPSKMAAFVTFILTAKYCLRNGIHLFMGTHNPILEQIVDDYAASIQADKTKYMKGQLFGFETKKNPESTYAIFGPSRSCIHYSLRRVNEGAGSHAATSSPLLNLDEINQIIINSKLNENLTKKEIEGIAAATQFNVQTKRVEITRDNLKSCIR